MRQCVFCDIAEDRAFPGAPENKVFARSEFGFAKPALGQFINGYSLLVSEAHVPSFSFLTRQELEDVQGLKERVSDMLGAVYRCPTLAFEHGCQWRAQARSGACIDHAHLHLLPLDDSLQRVLLARLCQWFKFRRLGAFADLAEVGELPFGYVYLEGGGEQLVFELDRLVPSQFMRRVIAIETGQPDAWDWRERPFRERIEEFNRRVETCAYQRVR